MTNKRERQTATFVTARQLRQFIEDQKTVNTYRIKGTNYYSSLYEAVLSFIAHLERNRKKEYSLSRYNQFAKRLEREFLRKEKNVELTFKTNKNARFNGITNINGYIETGDIFPAALWELERMVNIVHFCSFKPFEKYKCALKFVSDEFGVRYDISLDFKPLEK